MYVAIDNIFKRKVRFVSKYSTFTLSNKISSSIFLKLCALSLMIKKDEPVYGREILAYVENFNTSWKPSHGTLYPILATMIEDELISSPYECDHRKYYEITEKGKQYYNETSKEVKKILADTAKFYRAMSKELY